MTEDEKRVEAKLKELGIAYERQEHDAIMTVEEAKRIAAAVGSACMKNLFLCGKKKFCCLYLLPADKTFSSKDLSQRLGIGHLSFGKPEKMQEYLHTYPGAVTCMGLMFDTDHQVKVLVDKELQQFPYVDVHPCVNTASLKIAFKDIIEKWLPATGHADFIWV